MLMIQSLNWKAERLNPQRNIKEVIMTTFNKYIDALETGIKELATETLGGFKTEAISLFVWEIYVPLHCISRKEEIDFKMIFVFYFAVSILLIVGSIR